jgi:hypothetical protein
VMIIEGTNLGREDIKILLLADNIITYQAKPSKLTNSKS